MKILFETHTLKFATLATVSRCGMICMTDNIVQVGHIFQSQLKKMRLDPEITKFEEMSLTVEHLFD